MGVGVDPPGGGSLGWGVTGLRLRWGGAECLEGVAGNVDESVDEKGGAAARGCSPQAGLSLFRGGPVSAPKRAYLCSEAGLSQSGGGPIA